MEAKYGEKSSQKLKVENQRCRKIIVCKSPDGENEPELQGSKLQFRSLVIHEHYKLIYYYAPEKDLLRIVDI